MNEAVAALSVANKQTIWWAARDIAAQADQPVDATLVWTQSAERPDDIRFYQVDEQSGVRRRVSGEAASALVVNQLVHQIAAPDFDPLAPQSTPVLQKFLDLEQAKSNGKAADVRRQTAQALQLESDRHVEVGAGRQAILAKVRRPLGATAIRQALTTVEPMPSIFDQPRRVAAAADKQTLTARVRVAPPVPPAANAIVSAPVDVAPASPVQAQPPRLARDLRKALSPEATPTEQPGRLRGLLNKVSAVWRKRDRQPGKQADANSSERAIDWNMREDVVVEPQTEAAPIPLSWNQIYWHPTNDGISLYSLRGTQVGALDQDAGFSMQTIRDTYTVELERAQAPLKKPDQLITPEDRLMVAARLAQLETCRGFITQVTAENLWHDRSALAQTVQTLLPTQQLPVRSVAGENGTSFTFDVRGTQEHQQQVKVESRRNLQATIGAALLGSMVLGGALAAVFWPKGDSDALDRQLVKTELHASKLDTAIPPAHAPKPPGPRTKTIAAITHNEDLKVAHAAAEQVILNNTWRSIDTAAIGLEPDQGAVTVSGAYEYKYDNVPSGSGIGVWNMAESLIKARNYDTKLKATASKLQTAIATQYITAHAEDFGLTRNPAGEPVIYGGSQLVLPNTFLDWVLEQARQQKEAQQAQVATT